MQVQKFDYPQWLEAVRTRLASLRPDVKVDDLDPNACMRAFRAGHSPHDFASRPVLPLRSVPSPSPAPPAARAAVSVRAGSPQTTRVAKTATRKSWLDCACPSCGCEFRKPYPGWQLFGGILLFGIVAPLLLAIPVRFECPSCGASVKDNYW